MTVGVVVRKAGPYLGDGVQTVFAFGFKIFATSDVVVIKTSAAGLESVLAITTGYSVAMNADQNVNPGGSIITVVAPLGGGTPEKITISSAVPESQGTGLPQGGAWNASVVERALDKLTTLVGQLSEKLSRAVRQPISDSTVIGDLPTKDARRLKVLAFDANGLPIAQANVPTSGVAATAYMETLLDDQTAAQARATLEFAAATHLQDKNGADIAASATVNLDTTTGDLVKITGNTGITAFTLAEGVEKTLLFSGTPLITHGASLLCPGGVNIQVGANDTCKVRGYAAGIVRIFSYQPFENAPPSKLVAATGDILVATAARTLARKAIGADGEVPHADSTSADLLRYSKLGAGDTRQSVLSAAVDANGYNAAITIGSGLRPGLDASPTPMVLTFASGFGRMGAQDLTSILSADAADPLGADLPANNTSFLHATYSNIAAVAWGQALVPPQYGYAFDRTQGALLNFEGANASTTMLDDFGNTWTAVGSAQINTAQFKFGASSLLLDGIDDFVSTANIASLGDGSWEISSWARFNALPGANTRQCLFSFGPVSGGSNFGVALLLDDTAGTKKLALFASSNGTSFDIASNIQGVNTSWVTATWYKFRLVFDALAGTYRVYLSVAGAVESLEITTSSTARIASGTRMAIGRFSDGVTPNLDFNGWIDGFRFVRCATKTGTEIPSGSAPVITDYPYHFFALPEMKMYEVTGASVGAGQNPTMTQRNRLFNAEADTSGAAVTAVRNYALRGEYFGAQAGVGASTAFTFTHNLGIPREFQQYEILGRGTGTSTLTRWARATGLTLTDVYTPELESSTLAAMSGRNTFRGATWSGGALINGTAFTAGYELGLRLRRTF